LTTISNCIQLAVSVREIVMDTARLADLHRRRAKALRDQAEVEDAFAALIAQSGPPTPSAASIDRGRSAGAVSDIGRARAKKKLRELGVP
jgi:hypothetical protein